MKKLLFLAIALLFVFPLTGCKDDNIKGELVIFAASSMTESLTEIAQQYSTIHPTIEINFNFDSSGTLKTQIEEGADCDVFISASRKPMDKLDCVIKETRFDVLKNNVVLVVPKDNPKKINSFDDLISYLNSGDILLAIGNSDVPVGEYTINIFDHYNIDVNSLEKRGCITYGSNVKEVTTQVSENLVDCGIVYQTDANTADLLVVDIATKEMCGEVVYPAGIIDSSKNIDEATDFLDYLNTDDASTIFKKYGFTPIS